MWKVGNILGMCGQSIHERLVKLKSINHIPVYTSQEQEKITIFYNNGFLNGDGKLDKFCKEINRNKINICKIAKKLGLSNAKRKCSKSFCQGVSTRTKKYLKTHGHPKGMLGKTHSKEYKEICRQRQINWGKKASREEKMIRVKKAFLTKLQRYGTLTPNPEKIKVSWHQGWREIGNNKIYCRSRWEANYGRYLEWQKKNGYIKEWEHEPETFWFHKIKKGSVTYLPDFKISNIDGTHFWVEVKGWYDQRSKTKIKRFKKYYPKEKLVLVDAAWFKANNHKMKILIPEWEYMGRKQDCQKGVFGSS